ncbi:MAG: DNA photolyase [Deltaproteobacteria bacterium]|nr:DNA photolyase [Deltaproteobacteria bacterium]
MKILKLFIDDQVADTPEVASIRSRLGIQAQVVHDIREVYKAVSSAADPVQIGKEVLFLTRNRGEFVRNCPGTRFYTCCGYKILHIGTYCLMDCSYCILQSYFHPPVLQYFVNRQDLFKELEKLFADHSISRIGTGEFTDSMIWEAWTDLSNLLIPTFAGQSGTVLELKTKTTAIEKLKDLPHNRKTIVAWSLNTERIIRTEERGTASLSARLEAAARCESWGYPVAFHFDPIIVYEGCEAEYRTAVHKLLSRVSPENIVWISLGAFRFMPDLKAIIQRRFPNSKIVYGEFIPGVDAKMRYFKPIRIDIYRKMVSWIREKAPDVTIYFCMEDDEVWWKSLGFIPSERDGLSKMLDESAAFHCALS